MRKNFLSQTENTGSGESRFRREEYMPGESRVRRGEYIPGESRVRRGEYIPGESRIRRREEELSWEPTSSSSCSTISNISHLKQTNIKIKKTE